MAGCVDWRWKNDNGSSRVIQSAVVVTCFLLLGGVGPAAKALMVLHTTVVEEFDLSMFCVCSRSTVDVSRPPCG